MPDDRRKTPAPPDVAAEGRTEAAPPTRASRSAGSPDRGFVVIGTLLNAVFAFALACWAGTGREGTQFALRMTARVSLAWFMLAFLASPLHALRPCDASRRLLRWRRALGITFGLSMAIHVGFILRLFVLYSPERPPMVTDADFYVGIPGLLLVAAMTATSAAALRRRIDPLAWKRLHVAGLWAAWTIFLLCLVDSVGRKQTNHPVLAYGTPVAVLLAGAVLRLTARLRRSRRVGESAMAARPG